MASTSESLQLPQVVQSIDRVPGLRQALMLLALAASVALGVTVVLWMQRPLQSALPPMENMSQAHDMLRAAGIKVNDRGDRLTVPVGDFERAERLLVEGGYVSTDARNCDEMIGRGAIGRSLSEEHAALVCRREVEIARTITRLRPVQHASVHISDPDDGPFIGADDAPKASVEIALMPNSQADRELVQAIMHLVANAVPRLTSDNVTVVDSNGNHLSAMFGNSDMALSTEQLRHQRSFEMQKEDQIRRILGRTLGPEHYTVTVSAEMDFTSLQRTERRPTNAVVIGTSEQITEQSGAVTPPGGIPGSLTNTPVPTDPQDGEDQQGQGAQDAEEGEGGARNVSRRVTTNSEIGEAYEVFKSPSGRLERLTIAIMLDELAPRPGTATADAGGSAAAAGGAQQQQQQADGQDAGDSPRFRPEDLVKLEALIRDAVGFDAERGDRISIESMAFQHQRYEEIPPTPWWQQTLVMDLARQGLGALFVVVLFFTTVRPMISRLLATPPVSLTTPAGAYAQAALGGPGAAEGDKGGDRDGDYQQRVASARTLASEDPDRVAQIMRDWVNKD